MTSRKDILNAPALPVDSESTQFKIGYFSPQRPGASSENTVAKYVSDIDPGDEDVEIVQEDLEDDPGVEEFLPHTQVEDENDNFFDTPDEDESTTQYPPTSSSPIMMSDLPLESLSDTVIDSPPKKKRKTSHISADRALITMQSAAAPSTTGRGRRIQEPVNYARVKRAYKKKVV